MLPLICNLTLDGLMISIARIPRSFCDSFVDFFGDIPDRDGQEPDFFEELPRYCSYESLSVLNRYSHLSIQEPPPCYSVSGFDDLDLDLDVTTEQG